LNYIFHIFGKRDEKALKKTSEKPFLSVRHSWTLCQRSFYVCFCGTALLSRRFLGPKYSWNWEGWH